MVQEIAGKQDHVKPFIQGEMPRVGLDDMEAVPGIILFLHQGDHIRFKFDTGYLETGFGKGDYDPSGAAPQLQDLFSVGAQQGYILFRVFAAFMQHVEEFSKKALEFIFVMCHLGVPFIFQVGLVSDCITKGFTRPIRRAQGIHVCFFLKVRCPPKTYDLDSTES